MSEHTHQTLVALDEESWNERYGASARVWSGNPNPQLVAEIANFAPGRALDVGCGEGADAIWLARVGWNVVAIEIRVASAERPARARGRSRTTARIEWRHADLLAHAPEADSFDLVSAQFMQLSPEPRTRLFTALAASGGTLLVVGHDPSDMTTGVRRPAMYAANDIASLLDASWTVVMNEARPRLAPAPDGDMATIHDPVLVAARILPAPLVDAATRPLDVPLS